MNYIGILAQATESVANSSGGAAVTSTSPLPVEAIWLQITQLGPVEALTFISFGTVCLFYGWRIFKVLVAICFGLVGLFIGVWINNKLIGGNNVIWLATIFTGICAFFSIPLMRWGVSILGAAAGGILTTGAWLAFGLPADYFWAGGLVGLVAGGMLSFIVFKASVMLFTSLGGSSLMATGILAIIYKYMTDLPHERLQSMLFNEKWFLPAMVLIPMMIGMIVQNKFIKGSPDWSV